MNHYQNSISQLQRHEGLHGKPYHCSQKFLTIGYGRNLETRGITEDEAEEILLNDLSDVEQTLDDVVYRYESELLAMASLP